MLNRRKVMGMLGVGVAAGPSLASHAAEALGGQKMLRTAGYMSHNTGDVSAMIKGTLIDPSDHAKKITAFFARGVFPEFFERELREQAKHIGMFDPDILAKKSWSDSVKILEQRERNYQRLLEMRTKQWMPNNEREEFYKQNGFWL